MDGCVADAGDGGEHACPIDLLLCLLAVCGTFNYELWQIDLSCSDITLDGWNDCAEKKKKNSEMVQILKCECLLLSFALCNSQLGMFKFWTAGRIKQAI